MTMNVVSYSLNFRSASGQQNLPNRPSNLSTDHPSVMCLREKQQHRDLLVNSVKNSFLQVFRPSTHKVDHLRDKFIGLLTYIKDTYLIYPSRSKRTNKQIMAFDAVKVMVLRHPLPRVTVLSILRELLGRTS